MQHPCKALLKWIMHRGNEGLKGHTQIYSGVKQRRAESCSQVNLFSYRNPFECGRAAFHNFHIHIIAWFVILIFKDNHFILAIASRDPFGRFSRQAFDQYLGGFTQIAPVAAV